MDLTVLVEERLNLRVQHPEADAFWQDDVSGATVASGGLNMHIGDLSRVSQMLLNGGRTLAGQTS